MKTVTAQPFWLVDLICRIGRTVQELKRLDQTTVRGG